MIQFWYRIRFNEMIKDKMHTYMWHSALSEFFTYFTYGCNIVYIEFNTCFIGWIPSKIGFDSGQGVFSRWT